MPDPSPAPPAGPRPWSLRWSRRHLLLAAVALPAAGCSLSDPTIRGTAPITAPSRRSTPTPTPTPVAPGLERDVAAEVALAAGARSLRARTSADDDARRALLDLIARTHAERAAALTAPDPTLRPTSPPPPSGASPARRLSVAQLVDAERARVRRYRAAALAASGATALLWGSMAVASGSFAAGLTADQTPGAGRIAAHRPLAAMSDSEAVSALVASLHAAVWGYQLALGKLPTSGAAHDRARAGLVDRRNLQDRLVDQLRRAGVAVPAAAPAYDPGGRVRDADAARLLLQRIETRLLPFCGLWLASAARPADRTAALTALSTTAASATAWGAPLRAWPGWPD